ncbi:MAG: hypothetical protein NC416_14540 [Eubacterium sp.]|nr:hypothetical protein [Eubacterium sp.]
MQELYVEKASLETAHEIYEAYLKKDFPPEEIKSFSVIEKMWKKSGYFVYVFYENAPEHSKEQIEEHSREQSNVDEQRVPCAYAFLLADNKERMLLLDYFAVLEQKRGKGYGSYAFSLLRKVCADWNALLIEVESDELADIDEETRMMRKRRISFYARAGCLMTDVTSRLWGVDYRIMAMPLSNEYSEERTAERLWSLYKGMYDEQKLRKHFEILSE